MYHHIAAEMLIIGSRQDKVPNVEEMTFSLVSASFILIAYNNKKQIFLDTKAVSLRAIALFLPSKSLFLVGKRRHSRIKLDAAHLHKGENEI